jgi:hypothetical protein
MNLNTHVMLALAVGSVLFHPMYAVVLVGIGAAIPDLDREYVFTPRKVFSRYQLHRALLHNLFVALGALFFNFYLGVGFLLHIALDFLTSPTDRGVELFFPLGRLVRRYELSLEGAPANTKGFLWYLEDPVSLVYKTADPGLKEYTPTAWRRVYGPFKNGMLIDWAVFYSSLIFLLMYEAYLGNLYGWVTAFLHTAFIRFALLVSGIIIFYGVGEAWRRRIQFTPQVNRNYVLVVVGIALLLIAYQFSKLYLPIHVGGYLYLLGLSACSLSLGLIISFFQIKLRYKRVVM